MRCFAACCRALLIATIIAGCARRPSYSAILKEGMRSVGIVKEFNALYPRAHNWISYFSNSANRPIWNCKVGLHGRYLLEMQVEIAIDQNGHNIRAVGEPYFVVHEVTAIARTASGRPIINYDTRSERKFGVGQWQELVASHGDLGSIGVTVKKNEPVPGFSEAIDQE